MEKCGRVGQATDDITWLTLFACWITKATDTESRVRNTYCVRTATTVMRTPHVDCLVMLGITEDYTGLSKKMDGI